MDHTSYGDGQVHHQVYANSSQPYQQQTDYSYQQYQNHPSFHQSASSSSYYYPPEYNSVPVNPQPAASYAQQQPDVDAAPPPPGIDISNLAQAAAAAAANQQNGYFPHAITQQLGHTLPSVSHLMAAPVEPRMVLPVGLRDSRWVGRRGGGFGLAPGVGGLPFRGGGAGGRRGGRNLFRGGGRANFNPRMLPRSDNVLPPHARGGGRTGKGIARRPVSATPPQLLRCEVCKIECNSLEILEQHRQGKKHKRNVQKIEEEQKPGKLGDVPETKAPNETKVSIPNQQNEIPDSQNLSNLVPNVETTTEVDRHEANHDQPTKDAEQTAIVDVQQQQQPIGHSDHPHLTGHVGRGRGRGRLGSYGDRRMGPNKRSQGRPQFDPRHGKRARVSNSSSLPVDLPPLPNVCTICNIRCDSQAVLDCHLAGKKHAAKLKRLQSQPQLYGPQLLQALFLPQAQQVLSTTLAQPQPVFNPQNQQALLEALLSQAIQQVLAGQAIAASQAQSALPGASATQPAAPVPQVEEHGILKEEGASESEDEWEDGEEERNDAAQGEEVDEQEQGGDAGEEEEDDGVEGDVEPAAQVGDAQDNIEEDEGDEPDLIGMGVPTEIVLPASQNANSAAEGSTLALEFPATIAETVVPGLEIRSEEIKQTEDSEN